MSRELLGSSAGKTLCTRAVGEEARRRNFAADRGPDTELQSLSDSAETLHQALTFRQRLLRADVEEACANFRAGLA